MSRDTSNRTGKNMSNNTDRKQKDKASAPAAEAPVEAASAPTAPAAAKPAAVNRKQELFEECRRISDEIAALRYRRDSIVRELDADISKLQRAARKATAAYLAA